MKCERCGGFKIAEQFYGIDATVPAWTCEGSRCLNCGGISFATRTLEPRRGDGHLVEEHP